MWLPKDERHLLMAYYVSIGNIEEEVWFALEEWVRILDGPTQVPILTPWLVRRLACKAKHYPVNAEPSTVEQARKGRDPVKAMRRFLIDKSRIEMANKRLEARGLIKLRRNHSGTMMGIGLKIGGYDLGEKYSSWWKRSGLWFAEYKHHWIWVVGSFLGGITATLLTQWLSKAIIG